MQMLANGGEYQWKRYLSRKTVEFMLHDHLVGMGGSTEASTGLGYGFGLGFAVRLQDGFGRSAGSKGDPMWSGVFGTAFSIDPKELGRRVSGAICERAFVFTATSRSRSQFRNRRLDA